MGATILASSGDSGVRGECYEGAEYIASFPTSAVYVSAVAGVRALRGRHLQLRALPRAHQRRGVLDAGPVLRGRARKMNER